MKGAGVGKRPGAATVFVGTTMTADPPVKPNSNRWLSPLPEGADGYSRHMNVHDQA